MAGNAKIVVGIDGSNGSKLAALRAIEVFGPEAEYVLVAVSPRNAMGSERRALKRGLERAQELLDERGVTAELVERQGDPAEQLVALSNELEATMVVVGSRGAEMFMPGSDDAGRIGTIALALLNRRSCDVLVVHNPDTIPRAAQ